VLPFPQLPHAPLCCSVLPPACRRYCSCAAPCQRAPIPPLAFEPLRRPAQLVPPLRMACATQPGLRRPTWPTCASRSTSASHQAPCAHSFNCYVHPLFEMIGMSNQHILPNSFVLVLRDYEELCFLKIELWSQLRIVRYFFFCLEPEIYIETSSNQKILFSPRIRSLY
jgi:hypothetical protein